jgi:hypothetical protein
MKTKADTNFVLIRRKPDANKPATTAVVKNDAYMDLTGYSFLQMTTISLAGTPLETWVPTNELSVHRADTTFYVKTECADPFIKNIRLQKKIDKLVNQRNYYKNKLEHYQIIMNLHPHIERASQRFVLEREKSAHLSELENRVREQSALITKLMGTC